MRPGRPVAAVLIRYVLSLAPCTPPAVRLHFYDLADQQKGMYWALLRYPAASRNSDDSFRGSIFLGLTLSSQDSTSPWLMSEPSPTALLHPPPSFNSEMN